MKGAIKNRTYFFLIFLTVLFNMISCDLILVDERGDDLKKYDYYIDDYGNEGIVLNYSFPAMAVLSLDETEQVWGPMDYHVLPSVTPKVADEPAFGLAMLYAMHEAGIENFPAQKWCSEKNNGVPYNVGGWHLTSRYEWEEIIIDVINDKYITKKINELNTYIQLYGGTPISMDEYYWLCNEDIDGDWEFEDGTLNDYDPANRAQMIEPSLAASTNKDKWVKRNVYKVRAIKYVYVKGY